jgi:hypothetical protein
MNAVLSLDSNLAMSHWYPQVLRLQLFPSSLTLFFQTAERE